MAAALLRGDDMDERPTPRAFFDRYAELSLGTTPERLAPLYAPTFIVAGPEGSQAFANDGTFLDWLRQVRDFNQQHGMRSLEVRDIREVSLSPAHTLATVTWGARFQKTGDRLVEFAIAYLLERANDDWKILAYVSERDQTEEMQRLGLL